MFPRNPSGGSGLSETGSLDRAKAALERRKKAEDGAGNPILCRVEVTRPNPDSLIDELIKATNLEQTDLESSESTSLYTLCSISYSSPFFPFHRRIRTVSLRRDIKSYKWSIKRNLFFDVNETRYKQRVIASTEKKAIDYFIFFFS